NPSNLGIFLLVYSFLPMCHHCSTRYFICLSRIDVTLLVTPLTQHHLRLTKPTNPYLVLSPTDGMATFQAFLKSEFSDENIEFWLICEDFKKIRSSRLSSRAKKIFDLYIQAEAPKEINIDHHTREVIRQNVQAPTRLCFDDAQKIVFGLMEKDSYPRFLRSDIYRTLLESVSNIISV
uniref:Regulator of G protein signaling 13 n=1 Tax=Astyanax mexicanus TaxID=7994 RepID=A0A8B9GX97_ASTMX